MRDLQGKVAWITGAGSGIGEAGALALGAAGMRLVLSGRREAEVARVADAVKRAGGQARTVPLDVSDAGAIEAAAAGIERTEGRLDVLVNSAGINVPRRNWKQLARDDWDRVIRIDLDGAFYACRAVLPMMRRQRDGLIVNVSSIAGRRVSTLTGPAYSAAKFALNAMTESLNVEEGLHGIRATAVCPGEVATPILDKRPVPVTADERARMLQAPDLGELLLFLARLPVHVCINDLNITPTWNRANVPSAQAIPD